jgi:hypothetical protein
MQEKFTVPQDSCSTNRQPPGRKGQLRYQNRGQRLPAHPFRWQFRCIRLYTSRCLLAEKNSWKSVFAQCRRNPGKPIREHPLYVAEFQKFSGTRYIHTHTPA